jgi:guanine nucleotide-binding protein G(i) subunit alpha
LSTQSVRRPDESMTLFDEMCNSEVFRTVPLVLFLNKTYVTVARSASTLCSHFRLYNNRSDLFRAKLAQVDLSVCFPDYKGGADYDKACQFVSCGNVSRCVLLADNLIIFYRPNNSM